MSGSRIHGAEYPIKKIFSNDFNFRIPRYQRPYSWMTEQAGELLDDLLGFAVDGSNAAVEESSPYFLGSIVLIKSDGLPASDVVDGQQRLTTLTILLSALRHTIRDAAFRKAFSAYLFEEGNPLEGNGNCYRLTIRDRDADFFRTYIQEPDRLEALRALDPARLSDSQRNIRANASHFVDRLSSLGEDQRVRLARFIVVNCFLVVVSTPDLDSAYRIFSVLNDRGLDLSHADILKSEIVGQIADHAAQDEYTSRWEDAEESLGREAFGDLFSHVRMIYRKQKLRETILKEFREYVIRRISDSKRMIDQVLVPLADALETVANCSYQSTEKAESVNSMLRWLNRIDNTDWVPPAILYVSQHRDAPGKLLRFLCDLERLAVFLMLARSSINERLDRVGKLLKAIEEGHDLFASDSPLQLSDDEDEVFLDELNGDVYRLPAKRRQYILLRADSVLSDGSATYEHHLITIEHVLPQTPRPDSEWCRWFPSEELRDEWVHRLGNLLLLSRSKNSSAGNLEFAHKKSSYFMKGGVSAFAITTQAVAESEWTPTVVMRRQTQLLAALRKEWRLRSELPELDIEDGLEDGESTTVSPTAKSRFNEAMVPLIEQRLGIRLTNQLRMVWASDDGKTVVSCQVSKKYPKRMRYWYGFKRSMRESLEKAANAYCAFGLGSPNRVLLLPYGLVRQHLDDCRTSPAPDGNVWHWHIELREIGDSLELQLSPGKKAIDVSQYVCDQAVRENC